MYWFNKKHLEDLPDRFRARLINGLSGYKSANLIGTCDAKHQPNLAIVSSVVHLGANPALMGMVTRPTTVRRDTVNNIKEQHQFTINMVAESMVEKAHQTSAKYEEQVSEFSEVGLSVEWIDDFQAPCVSESPISIGLDLKEILPIELNGTEFIIGQIKWVRIREDVLQPDGSLELSQIRAAAVTGLDCYHVPSKGQRYHYAVPEHRARELPTQGNNDIHPPVNLKKFWAKP
ncbi:MULTISPECIES: flavin reductase family protein [Gammaproteobacteria]|uniref:flavin reductase family protein n=1 Tax=Gammaproteobacteria TaxID=1236 RepID=UPI000DCFA3AC|nr:MULTISPECIES: flavin reductase [Gammaproteobacteria]RTE87737.1 flavin oxidoreductase [Aliidiomarina sp. B3213]TCZ92481.1 flavin oxidoreductase [Lysobacter sp. N42]